MHMCTSVLERKTSLSNYSKLIYPPIILLALHFMLVSNRESACSYRRVHAHPREQYDRNIVVVGG
jgi:hypothetical protein